MSSQDYYRPPQGPNHLASNNPYAQSQYEQHAWQSQPSSGSPRATSGHPYGSGSPQALQSYEADPPPGPPPRRSDTFQESDFVPENERGEQREAMEQFEMSKGEQSQEESDKETLQREFPHVDGSLIAALYSDCQSLGGTREMLQELDEGSR
ncbi:hypothetical protein M433DRAFT_149866 [Acidomyces richmondensis BFW]|nr:MAG: hypothetical protein FE78DRAFT_92977 [Acidomyces sp. 'richmondensis']KYG49555.1 hypothetical protein M433DRAFT_149866 [Acidomyces richmondensis BFW]